MSLKSIAKRCTRILSDKTYTRLAFFRRFHRFPNLKDPKTFNEKLQWLKLYNRKPEYTTMVDKYEAKKYVAEKLGEEYII
ncbi:MAG: glycosyl transferase, partial [Clostridia bacterium]|nr:glycosyl transferase [Clostridia bacterium]